MPDPLPLAAIDAPGFETPERAAYARAVLGVQRELPVLLMLLRYPGSSPDAVTPRAKAALDAVGLLWEAAARLSSPK